MADYIAEYTEYLTTERHSSDNTVSSYVRDVTQFSRYLSENEGIQIPECREEHIERYMAYMTGKGKSPAGKAEA